MAKTFLTSDLIARVKRYATVPTAQPLFSTNDFIDFLNDEMIDTITRVLAIRG